jgi:hypothetical protein
MTELHARIVFAVWSDLEQRPREETREARAKLAAAYDSLMAAAGKETSVPVSTGRGV